MTKPVIIGDAALYLGDCLDVASMLPVIDALITDPPYGVNLGNHSGAKEKRTKNVLVKCGYESYIDTPENFQKVVAPALVFFMDLCKRSAIFCPAPLSWLLPAPDVLGGVHIPAAVGRNKWGYSSLAQVLFYGTAPNLHRGAKATIFRGHASVEELRHPCPKPLPWMMWLVGLASAPTETVLDPFMGSGTTGVACVQANRKFIGIEIEPKYFDVACERIENAQRQARMFT